MDEAPQGNGSPLQGVGMWPSPRFQQPRHGPGMQLRRINATVVGVLLLFVYEYGVAVGLIIVPWLSYSVPGVTNLWILTVTTGVALFSYLFCVVMDPGSVPKDWEPDLEQLAVTEVKRKGGAVRVCQKCGKPKPPRTHHCRVCQRCVLRMDHHCPWTNNCIGHANYRAFIVFLVYVCAALGHALSLIVSHALHIIQTSRERRVLRTGPQAQAVHLQSGWSSSLWLPAAAQVVAFAIALPAFTGLLVLLGWHVQLIVKNKTTIEYQEGVRAALQSGAVLAALAEHPYDLGLCANLHETLGDNAAEWCLPPCRPTEGGTRYRTVWDQQLLGF